MKKQFQVLITVFFVFTLSQTVYTEKFSELNSMSNKLSSIEISKSLTPIPMTFAKNMGQWDSKVLFRADAGGATMWFSSDGAYYQFTRKVDIEEESSLTDVTQSFLKGTHHESDKIETITIKANFVGANVNPIIIGSGLIDYKTNYFIGNDQSKWATDVPNFQAVVYEKIYNGIDLKYYGNGTRMEYDFIVSPGADFSQIKIQYDGAKSILINDNGELVVATKWGEVVEQRPVVYQNIDAVRIPVEGKYELVGDNSFSFALSAYDPEFPLVIDPALSYSTYLGGNDVDYGYDIAVDSSGAAYITGKTFSTNFPTLDPFQDTFRGGDAFFKGDVFVAKISNSGSLVYSTYLGGSIGDVGYGIAVNTSGEVYVTGVATSDDFPLLNPYDETVMQGDAFVTKLSSSGNSLIYSTFLGGARDDWGYAIAVDTTGAAYVTGKTFGSFPLLNPYDGLAQSQEAFVTKLSSSGNSLIYSTYLGGSEIDIANGIAVDASGAAYITGQTSSEDFPMLNPYIDTFQGNVDAFVTKLNSSGNNLIYSTYLGGSNYDESFGITVDASGAAYLTGATMSINYPTSNSYIGTAQGGIDAFVTKLSSSGNSLIYSTYLGGNGTDIGYSISVDATEAVYVTGKTESDNFPTLNSFQEVLQDFSDAFVTKLNSSGKSLIYSTYLGGDGVDNGLGIRVNSLGEAYVSGNSKSTNFPMFNPYLGTYQGEYDAFVTKFNALSSCCIGIRGNIDGNFGNNIDIADLMVLISSIFYRGEEPPCYEEADVDGSGEIDIGDLVGMVLYIYNDGVAPTTCP